MARQDDAVANGLNEFAGLPAYLFRTLPWTVKRCPQPNGVRSGGKRGGHRVRRHTTDHDLGDMAGPHGALSFHHFWRGGFGGEKLERVSTGPDRKKGFAGRSEEHTSELQSLMRISYAVFCLKKKKKDKHTLIHNVTTEREKTNKQDEDYVTNAST